MQNLMRQRNSDGNNHGIAAIGGNLDTLATAVAKLSLAQGDGDGVHKQGLAHLRNMKTPGYKTMKNRILDKYTEKAGCFMAMISLRKTIQVHDSGIRWWDSSKHIREKVLAVFQTQRCELLVLFLVLTDLVMVILEAVLDSIFTFGHGDHDEHNAGDHHEHDAGHGSSHRIDNSTAHEAEDADGHRRLRMVIRTVARPTIRRFLAAGEGSSCNIDKAYEVASTCRIISLSILFFFALETVIKFICAPKGFFKHAGSILDFTVVTSSIILEFTLHHSSGGFSDVLQNVAIRPHSAWLV